MIVVMVKMRMKSPRAAQDMCRIHNQASELYQEPGSLGAHCVTNCSDPLQLVIVEEWGSRAAFDGWYKSPARARYEQESAHLRVGPIQIEVYEEA